MSGGRPDAFFCRARGFRPVRTRRPLELRTWAEELLAENGNPFVLPRSAFVFLVHQGYEVFYFDTASGAEDAPVRYCVEGGPGPREQFSKEGNICESYVADVTDAQQVEGLVCHYVSTFVGSTSCTTTVRPLLPANG